jgi:GTP 3',8-cyclase
MVIFPQLETNVTTYCQNKCVSCNHIIPLVEKPAHLDPALIERDLSAFSKIAHADVYCMIGGEPTLHPGIVDIMRIIKRSGIANELVTYTNGQSMRHLPDAFYQELDRLFATPYKVSDEDREYITRKCAEFGLPLEWHSTNFTRSFYRAKHSPDRAAELFRQCWFRYNRSVIDDGYFYRCCTSPFMPFYLMGQAKTADGMALDGITEQGLRDYLNPKDTPEICYQCGSNCGPSIGWHETTRDRWMEESIG